MKCERCKRTVAYTETIYVSEGYSYQFEIPFKQWKAYEYYEWFYDKKHDKKRKVFTPQYVLCESCKVLDKVC